MIKPLLGKEIQVSPVYRVMTILVDSGIFYMLFFVRLLLAKRPAAGSITDSVVYLPCMQAAEAILSFNSFNVSVDKHAGLSFAMQIYQFQTSSIVVCSGLFN